MRPDWLSALRRYAASSLLLHLVWEVLQLPLFTLWTSGTRREIAFAVFHCTLGDWMIASLSLLAALMFAGAESWPHANARRVYVLCLAFGVAYTIYSEWMNVSVRGSWAYAPQMPLLPMIGTGLSPVLQWLIVPTIAFWIAMRRRPRDGTLRP